MSALEVRRRQAWDAFQRIGLPHARMEDWKYTDLSRAAERFGEEWYCCSDSEALQAPAFDALDIDAWRLVFVDGVFVAESSDVPPDMQIAPLSALGKDVQLGLMDWSEDAAFFNGLVPLNAALARDGVSICLPAGRRLEKPVHVVHVQQGKTAHTRSRLHLQRDAELVLIEQFLGAQPQQGAATHHLHVHLEHGARCLHYRLQQEAEGRWHLGRIDGQLGQDADYRLYAAELGADLSRTDIALALSGIGASCELRGLMLADGRQHLDHHTRVEHLAAHGRSRESYRALVGGRARGVFNGQVVVRPGAAKTDSAQSVATLLLSGRAEMDAKPELEIYHDDVKAAHGCTVGQLDAMQLFYLQSRGLPESEARELLMFAFADAVLADMPHGEIRRYIERRAFSRLPAADRMGEVLV